MNDFDRNNLKFIMSMPQKAFEAWVATITEDEVEYALDLIAQARLEVDAKFSDIVLDFTEARGVLGKFTLSGKIA